jgi:hypothetical protein
LDTAGTTAATTATTAATAYDLSCARREAEANRERW